jgi:hypothetical protein
MTSNCIHLVHWQHTHLFILQAACCFRKLISMPASGCSLVCRFLYVPYNQWCLHIWKWMLNTLRNTTVVLQYNANLYGSNLINFSRTLGQLSCHFCQFRPVKIATEVFVLCSSLINAHWSAQISPCPFMPIIRNINRNRKWTDEAINRGRSMRAMKTTVHLICNQVARARVSVKCHKWVSMSHTNDSCVWCYS